MWMSVKEDCTTVVVIDASTLMEVLHADVMKGIQGMAYIALVSIAIIQQVVISSTSLEFRITSSRFHINTRMILQS